MGEGSRSGCLDQSNSTMTPFQPNSNEMRGFPPKCRGKSLFRHSLSVLILLIAVTQLWAKSANAAESRHSDYQVKAAFLMNFTKFVDWPPAAFANPESPMTICIWGDDPFRGALDQIVDGVTVNGHRLVLQRLRHQPAKGCHVLFFGSPERDVSKVIAGLDPGILTVGDGDNFLKEGGMIALVVDNHRVRFDVNQRNAEKSALRISSRLLGVARFVEQ